MTAKRYEEWAHETLDIRSLDGDEANALCPIHNDHRPSFRFNISSGLWICHACGESGNAKMLSDRLGIPLPGESQTVDDQILQLDALVKDLEKHREPIQPRGYGERWLQQFQIADDELMAYWHGVRNLPLSAIQHFGLGFDPNTNAATIPLRDSKGIVLGVIRRFMEDTGHGKYLYPRGFKKSQFLFGMNEIQSMNKSVVVLTEGSLDAIACWTQSIPAVAILGSGLSKGQARLIEEMGVSTIVTMMDNDVAGRKAVYDIQRNISPGIQVFVADLQEWGYNDPMEVIEASKGEILPAVYGSAIPFYYWA